MTTLLQRIILLFLLLQLTVAAQNLSRIEISGNKNFDTKDLINWCNLKYKTNFSNTFLDSIKENLSAKLSEYGYFYFTIKEYSLDKLDDTGSVVLKLIIDEGLPAYINHINIAGDTINIGYVFKEFEYMEGRIFSKEEFERSIANILDWYENSGYPFARIITKSVDVSYDSSNNKVTANIFINMDPGRKSKIDKIEIAGNKKTKEYVITRNSRVNLGTSYSQKEIEEIPSRLNKLLFFEPVSSPSFYFNSRDEGVLLIEVKEKVTNNFDGILGYVPANEFEKNSKGYLTGLVNISLRNLFGTGRSAAVRWQQIDRYSQEMQIKYMEPWFFSLPFNINLEFFQLKRDTTFVQHNFTSSVEYLASSNISSSFIFSTTSVIPTLREIPAFTVYHSSTISTGVNLKIDTRDDYYSPTEGVYFLNTYTFNRKKIYGPLEYINSDQKLITNYQKYELDFLYFRQLFRRNVLAVGVHGREMRGSDFEISDLYKLGGTNTLRGYREQQFLGNRIAWSNLEDRLLLARRTFVYAFLDAGYYSRQLNDPSLPNKTDAFKFGYGLGFNVETGLGVLNISYALANGDSFGAGKIHFGLVSEF